MQAQFDQPGMPKYRIIPGVIGRDIPDSELPKLYGKERAVRDFGRELTRGEIGAALAHMAAQQCIVDNAMPVALIMEDDAVIGNQFLIVLDHVLKMIDPSKPQVILLNHVGRYSAWGGRKIDKLHRLYKPYTAWGGLAHLMTLPAAKALLEYQKPIHVMPDSWMHFYRKGVVDVRGVVPYVVGNAPLWSASIVGDDRLQLNQKRGFKRWVRKYIWQKFVFQLFVKPALRLGQQDSTW